MTVSERSKVQRRLTVMLAEINDLAFKFSGTPVQQELELAYRHLNRGAIEINRVPIEIALQDTVGIAR